VRHAWHQWRLGDGDGVRANTDSDPATKRNQIINLAKAIVSTGTAAAEAAVMLIIS